MVRNVSSITALGRNGVSDWLIQRVSALIMLAYVFFLIGFYLTHPQIDYVIWRALFAHTSMRIFTLLTLIALLGHAWVGMWTIFTDYIKCAYFRGALQIIIIFGFLAAFAWGIQILWS